MMIKINDDLYEIHSTKEDLCILKNNKTKKYCLYNKNTNTIELDNYDKLDFAYTSPLFAKELRAYRPNELTSVIAGNKNGNGLITIYRANGKNISYIEQTVPLEYNMVHVVTRGTNKNADSPSYNETCIIYTSKKDDHGLYLFMPQNIQGQLHKKKILKGEIPCIFDEICEYYNSGNTYSRWWRESEVPDTKLFYVRKGKNCGVYNALEGKYEVEPKFEQVSPQQLLKGYRASKGRVHYIIIDDEEYIPRSSLISNMIFSNQKSNASPLKSVPALDEELDLNL